MWGCYVRLHLCTRDEKQEVKGDIQGRYASTTLRTIAVIRIHPVQL